MTLRQLVEGALIVLAKAWLTALHRISIASHPGKQASPAAASMFTGRGCQSQIQPPHTSSCPMMVREVL